MEQTQRAGGGKKAILTALASLTLIGGAVLVGWYWRRSATPKITVDKEGALYVIRKNGAEAAKLGREQLFSDTVKMYKQDKQYAYIAAVPEGLEGGYLLFDPGVYKLYRLDLNQEGTAGWKDLSRGDTAIQAVSPDDRFVVYAEYGAQKKAVIREIESGKEFSVPVPQHYGQFGSMQFSPDSNKLAYAAAIGFPGKESGAVFTVDIATEQLHLVALTKEPDTYFIVRGWKNNNGVDYAVGPNLNPPQKD